MKYGMVAREDNTNSDGIGIGGGVAGYEGQDSLVTFYVEVPDVEAALVKAESLGGSRRFGPERSWKGWCSATSPIPRDMSSDWSSPLDPLARVGDERV